VVIGKTFLILDVLYLMTHQLKDFGKKGILKKLKTLIISYMYMTLKPVFHGLKQFQALYLIMMKRTGSSLKIHFIWLEQRLILILQT
jgi:hypothetical protein